MERYFVPIKATTKTNNNSNNRNRLLSHFTFAKA